MDFAPDAGGVIEPPWMFVGFEDDFGRGEEGAVGDLELDGPGFDLVEVFDEFTVKDEHPASEFHEIVGGVGVLEFEDMGHVTLPGWRRCLFQRGIL